MYKPDFSQPDNIIEANIDAYSRIIETWDESWNEKNETMHEPCRTLFLENLPGKKILDAGCGIGRDSMFFYGRGLKVTAADIVPGFLHLIRKKEPGLETLVMDITRPCFGDSVFDGIYCFASFLHVPRLLSLETLRKLHTILKPGGVLFLHHVASRKGFETYRVDDLLIPDNPAYCSCHDEQELTKLAEQAGFITELHHVIQPQKPSAVAKQYGLEPYQLLAFA